MRTSNCKVEAITSKGHRFFRFRQAEVRWSKRAKKIARRAQRRDNHKEIEAQLVEVEPYFIGKKMYWPTLANIFAPIPHWLMDDWEREGMVFYRQLKSVQALRKKKGVLGWKHDAKRIRNAYSWCDETLFETLQRSVNRS